MFRSNTTRSTPTAQAYRRLRGRSRLAVFAGATALAMTLSACSSGADGAGTGDGYGDSAIALSWIKNYEFGGYYLADENGYFTDAGFGKVDLLAGGGQTNSWDSVLANNALFGLASDLTAVSTSIAGGAPLVVVGAQYVRSPVGFVSLEGNPVGSIEQLQGKTIGVDASGKLAVQAVLKANGLPEDYVSLVSVPSGIDPLMNGDVDALIGFLTNYPLAVANAGGSPVVLSFSDAGYGQVGDAIVATRESLEENRDELKAMLVASIKGWNDAVTDTQSVVDAAMKYGKDNDLDVTLQQASADLQPSFMLTDDTVANGLFTISDDLADESVRSMNLSGIEISKEDLFDSTLLDEVYEEHPELIPGLSVPSE